MSAPITGGLMATTPASFDFLSPDFKTITSIGVAPKDVEKVRDNITAFMQRVMAGCTHKGPCPCSEEAIRGAMAYARKHSVSKETRS